MWRRIWWIATPIAFLGWLLAPRESVVAVSFEPFAIALNPLPTSLHPILDELLAFYRVTGAAIVLMIAIVAWSHVRRTQAAQMLSLLLPVYIAAIEACRHFTWFGRCHSFTHPPALDELQRALHLSGGASAGVVVLAIFIAAGLATWCRAGVAGRLSWQIGVAALSPLASVILLWMAMSWVISPPR